MYGYIYDQFSDREHADLEIAGKVGADPTSEENVLWEEDERPREHGGLVADAVAQEPEFSEEGCCEEHWQDYVDKRRAPVDWALGHLRNDDLGGVETARSAPEEE